MKFMLLSLIFAIGCSHQPVGHRSVANADSCAELAKQISDEVTLHNLGCTKDGKHKNVVDASAEWSSFSDFDEIDVQGIMMDAIQKAHRECVKTSRLCVIKNIDMLKANNESDGRRHTQFEVVMHGVDSYIFNGKLKQFEASNTSFSSIHSGQLILLASQYGAVSKALNDCYKAGFPLCAIGGYNLTESNNYRGGKYYTSAKATVIGVDFLMKRKSGKKKQFTFEHGFPVPLIEFFAD